MNLIVREAERMERLTNELLELVRGSNENTAVEFYPIVLSETVREAIRLLKNQADSKDIHFVTSFDEQIIVEGNEEKLKQIFINVIENAIRYSNNDSKISILTKMMKDNAVIEITDQGIGIPDKDLPHITERFYRVKRQEAEQTVEVV